jgi:hypothetical protein
MLKIHGAKFGDEKIRVHDQKLSLEERRRIIDEMRRQN